MKLGIMQPYFFPYLNYFALMKYADKWVVFDDVQYIYHGWVNRNRILNYNKDWQYIIAPLVKHSRGTHIKNIKLANHLPWKEKILAQLVQYKKRAPNYRQITQLIHEALSVQTDSLAILNTHILELVCEYLGITTDLMVYSEHKWDMRQIEQPDEWALKVAEILNAVEYVNPPNGVEFFDKSKYEEKGIKLSFLKMKPLVYEQKRSPFIPNLSVIDTLMFLEPQKILESLDEYEFI